MARRLGLVPLLQSVTEWGLSKEEGLTLGEVSLAEGSLLRETQL